MNRYILALDPLPSQLAYYDGERYHCYEDRCIIVNAHVEECGRIPVSEDTYLPVLRCQCCGTLYYGIDTTEDEPPYEPPYEPPSPPARHETQHQGEDIILPNLLTAI